MMETDEGPTPDLQLVLEGWPVADPPPDFTSRVVQDLTRDAATRRGRRRALAVSVGLAAAAVLLVVVSGRREGESGTWAGGQATLLRLAGRAVAETDARATLEWQVRGGTARVSQPVGSVLYRVSPGGSFVVETPSGRIEVKGTTFRVEVTPMKTSASQALAAVAMVAVSVYEGEVVVRNDRGHLTLSSGMRAVASPHAPPAAVPAAPPPAAPPEPAPLPDPLTPTPPRPVAAPGKPAAMGATHGVSGIRIRGALDKEIVGGLIANRLDQVKRCRNGARAGGVPLDGRVTVHFVIAGTGKVASAIRQASTLKDEGVESCVIQTVSGWLFPSSMGRGSTIVTYPFDLSEERQPHPPPRKHVRPGDAE